MIKKRKLKKKITVANPGFDTNKQNPFADEVSPEKRAKARKMGLAVFAAVALMFIAIIFVSDLVELKFGKVAGTIALCIFAAIIAVFLYKKEISDFFRKIFRKK